MRSRGGPPPLQLPDYDVILVNISGGKDSQAMLDVTVHAAGAAAVSSRVVAVFADLGSADEWPGTADLAAEHAAHYGLRFEVVRREVTDPATGERRPQGLIEHIASRPQQKWPDAARRYCTSDLKRAPVYRLMTRLAAEQRAAGAAGRPVRILNVLGMRAAESPRRALLTPFSRDDRASNGVRHVDQWLPIHAWDTAQVWERIAAAGTRPHPVYAHGMPRLSCRFCVLASRSALVLAARLDPDGALRRANLEDAMGHQFRADMSMREIITEAAHATSWRLGSMTSRRPGTDLASWRAASDPPQEVAYTGRPGSARNPARGRQPPASTDNSR
jgi:3'-phosphoadenosine 5'-phosphosulfate sulfotransferase (PAPS reductase)/FAD synthetase